MKISLKLLLEELKYDAEGQPVQNPVFSGAEIYTAKGADMTGGSLLVCTLSEALDIENRDGLYFLCVRDRMVDSRESEEAMRGLIVVRKNIELRELFNEVQRIFNKIQKWQINMQQSVIRDEGIKELLNLSQPVIGNHIDVMDAAFKLIAHTENIDIDDEVTNDLLRHGFHTDETIKRFQLKRRIEQFEKADESGIIVSDDRLISNCTVVKKVFKYYDTYSVIVVMPCIRRECTEGLLALFQMLIDNIKYYVERDYHYQGRRGPCELLVCDILDRNLHQEEDARRRASYANLPFDGCFDLIKLVLNDTFNTPISRINHELASTIPESHIILYRRDILALNLYKNGADAETRTRRLERLRSMLGNQCACCGVSNPFFSLWSLPVAYEQAETAVSIGTRLASLREPDKGDYYFEDYYLYHLLEYCIEKSPHIFKNSFAFDAVKQLSEHDAKHKTNTLPLLYTYLCNERSATETCAQLHMHRNTVLYHIGKIEELLGIDLSEPDTRLKLLLAYKAYELDRPSQGFASKSK